VGGCENFGVLMRNLSFMLDSLHWAIRFKW
jgi:hypothetical protein